MRRRRNRTCKGSLTVEAAFLMPLVGLILVSSLLLLFYFHDKNIISSCAYETAVIGSTKAREREGADAAFCSRRSGIDPGQVHLFPGRGGTDRSRGEEITVRASAVRRGLHLQVEQRAAVTDPEEHIRDLRRLTG